MLIPSLVDSDFSLNKVVKVHIRNQQRNGKKTITTVSGLTLNELDLIKIVKIIKKKFGTSACIKNDDEFGSVLCVQGDFRNLLATFFIDQSLCTRSQLEIHGC
jgi:translation initiation factor 1